MNGWTKAQIAARVAADIQEGMAVNLGIGLPTLVADFISAEKEVILHSENGILGMGPKPPPGQEDWDLVNAGKQAITAMPGASYFHHADSFGMMRGGHIDICVLGAYQVSAKGNLANWHTGNPDDIPAVGGAMDLAVGAKQTYVMMEHLTKTGQSKLVEECSYPLTGLRCVDRVYTNLAVIEISEAGPTIIDMAEGCTVEYLQSITTARLRHLHTP